MSGGADRIEVKRFSMLYQAELAVTLLRSHGIDADLPDRNLVSANSLLLNSMGGVRVTVPDAQIVEARRILTHAEWSEFGGGDEESEAWMEEAVPGRVGDLHEAEIHGALGSGSLKNLGRIAVIILLVSPLAGCLLLFAFSGR